jgi:hypothetical protein
MVAADGGEAVGLISAVAEGSVELDGGEEAAAVRQAPKVKF